MRYGNYFQYEIENQIIVIEIIPQRRLPYQLRSDVRIEVDWTEIIRRVCNREGPVIFSRFDYKIIPLRIILTPPFN